MKSLVAAACLAIACLLRVAEPPPAQAAAAVDQAISQLVAQLEDGAPEETINGIAIWLWLDDKLPEPVRRAFRDDLEVALINSPRFVYFNRDRFRQLLREHQLTLAQLADPAAMKAFAAAGIDGFLSVEVLDASCAHPEFKEQDAYCVLLAKLTDAKTATIAWAAFIEGANPAALKALLADAKPTKGTTRYRELATAIADSLRKTDPLRDPVAPPAAGAEPNPAAPPPAAPAAGAPGTQRPKVITLSTPNKDGSAGIGVQNPINAPFDLKTFQDELLVAISKTGNYAYVDPSHIARLVAAWTRDSEATAAANKAALAAAFALDGYLFGEIRSADERSTQLSMRLTSLRDGSEAWAAKLTGTDSHLRIEPRPLPEPPIPREEPPEPAPLTLEEIERPLKPPVPQPDLLPLPEIPVPPQYPCLRRAVAYAVLGLPRDALDAAFQVADRVPLLGAATTALYRYSGLSFLCRLGTRQRFRDEIATPTAGTAHPSALTWGQLASADPFPTFFPLITSARRHPTGSSNYALQLSLGTLTIFDALDGAYSVLDRLPAAGALTSTITLPLNYAWRAVPDDREDFLQQVTPAGPHNRLTFGGLLGSQHWSLLPNARSWSFTDSLPWVKARVYRDFGRRHQEAVQANEKLLNDWLAEEEKRRKYNDDALKTLRERNAELRRKHEREVERIRRENDEAAQRYQNDRRAVEEHNLRAKTLNAIGQVISDIPGALVPKPPRPALPAKPRPRPAVRPPVAPPAAPAAPVAAPAEAVPAPVPPVAPKAPAVTPKAPAQPGVIKPRRPAPPKADEDGEPAPKAKALAPVPGPAPALAPAPAPAPAPKQPE